MLCIISYHINDYKIPFCINLSMAFKLYWFFRTTNNDAKNHRGPSLTSSNWSNGGTATLKTISEIKGLLFSSFHSLNRSCRQIWVILPYEPTFIRLSNNEKFETTTDPLFFSSGSKERRVWIIKILTSSFPLVPSRFAIWSVLYSGLTSRLRIMLYTFLKVERLKLVPFF